eukprot:365558-Chlamydomonas_euryale.AAC.4
MLRTALHDASARNMHDSCEVAGFAGVRSRAVYFRDCRNSEEALRVRVEPPGSTHTPQPAITEHPRPFRRMRQALVVLWTPCYNISPILEIRQDSLGSGPLRARLQGAPAEKGASDNKKMRGAARPRGRAPPPGPAPMHRSKSTSKKGDGFNTLIHNWPVHGKGGGNWRHGNTNRN